MTGPVSGPVLLVAAVAVAVPVLGAIGMAGVLLAELARADAQVPLYDWPDIDVSDPGPQDVFRELTAEDFARGWNW